LFCPFSLSSGLEDNKRDLKSNQIKTMTAGGGSVELTVWQGGAGTSRPPLRTPLGPRKKSCLDGARNGLARSASGNGEITIAGSAEKDHRRCQSRMFCFTARPLRPWGTSVGSTRPSCVRPLLASPRWESRLLHFLDLSGVG
jgi:hypothetical protein